MSSVDRLSFVVLGTTEFTLACVDALTVNGAVVRALVTLPEHLKPENSIDFRPFSKLHNIELLEYPDLNSAEAIEKLTSLQVDYILSTWPTILSEEFLQVPKKFVIGTHPTKLPIGRGRHPLHWLTVLNIEETSLSFFVMNTGIDKGQVLLQQRFNIETRISETCRRMNEAATKACRDLLRGLQENNPSLQPQGSPSFSNYWRRRDFHDITLDPRMSSEVAIRIVNSFTAPYSCARLYIHKGEHLNIMSAMRQPTDEFPKNWVLREHGYIYQCSNDRLLVRFDDAVLSLKFSGMIDRDISGTKLHPPSYYFAS